MNTPAPPQRIIKIRRDYNTWVANETIEDYALRFTPRTFRKWSEFRVANTAFGAISFLALEAIGGSIALNYGFTNAFWAIMVVGLLIFLTGLPICYYASKYGLDMDLLTRGAGFGYIGSTITSLIYASFTFLFFALEASIMALALELYFHIPLAIGYLLCSLAVIPFVTHGITLISRLQGWTQPIWLIMLVAPFLAILWKDPHLFNDFQTFAGRSSDGGHFDVLLFGAAATVVFSLIPQIGEQVDFLRFLPEKTRKNRVRWYAGLLVAGPGWIVLGVLKLLGGAFLAFVALQQEIPFAKAMEPTQMYLVGFKYVFASPEFALAVTVLFVIISQIKINVTNAYAGSLAWSNFFARITHSHPGRVVWLVFNVLIAVVLMEMGVFHALEQVLGLYSNVAIAWVGAVVADLVINKPLGLSPKGIEFKRAHLYDINPVGVGSMLLASVLAIAAFGGFFGEAAQAFSPFIALLAALITSPLIAWMTKGRYYIARQPDNGPHSFCSICEKPYEHEDMAYCPAYRGSICSLCCSLDARCHDACKPHARLAEQILAALRAVLPPFVSLRLNTRIGHYLMLVSALALLLGMVIGLIYYQEALALGDVGPAVTEPLKLMFFKVFTLLFLITGIGAWWLVLTQESRQVAQEESNRQTHLLMNEIDAHQRTDDELQKAKQLADRANQAKSRYITGISHELRTPLNSILGYAQLLEHDASIPRSRQASAAVIRRSGEHLLSLIDGLLDIAKIEAGKLTLETTQIRFPEFMNQIANMFRLQAESKGIRFEYEAGELPEAVRADKKRLGQILINILSNAIKFTERGGVTLRLSYRSEMATFEIEDSGCGISAEDLQLIFLPFERGNSTSMEGGTGLGLTIAKMLTDLKGGELTVRSVPSIGSVFQVRLFLPEVRSANILPATLNHNIQGYAGERRRILVVDNEAVDRELLVTVLTPLGFVVEQVASGIECLRVVSIFNPDLILLDIGMPGLDGWETARLLRNNRLSLAPILMVSANAFDRGRENTAGIELDDFIVKPVTVADLLERIRIKLNLEWLTQTPAAPPEAAPSEKLASDYPTLAQLNELVDLGNIGYVRGILEKLDEIDRDRPGCLAFTDRLRTYASQFQLADFNRLIKQVIDHDTHKP